MVAPLVAVLLASEEPDTQRELRSFLDGYVSAANEGVTAITAAADELAKQGDRPALATLERMRRLSCFSRTFACRRAVVQAMIQIRLPQAIDALTDLLPGVDGEVRGDVVRRLVAVSGQQYGNQSDAWQKWWKEHKDGFQFPTSSVPVGAPAAIQPKTASYYGLAIEARRMVFVVDISGSMAGRRLQAVKRELTTAIDGLPPEAAFNLVIFSSRVAAWQRSLRLATPAVKQAARAYVYNLRAGGDTAAYDALEAAFQFDVRGDLLPLRRRSEPGQDRGASRHRGRRGPGQPQPADFSLHDRHCAGCAGQRAEIGSWRSWRRRISGLIAASISEFLVKNVD